MVAEEHAKQMKRLCGADLASVRLLVIGIGNPVPKYLGTRHNVGRDFLSDFVSRYPSERFSYKQKGMLCSFSRLLFPTLNTMEIHMIDFNGKRVAFGLPQAFINHSGHLTREVSSLLNLSSDRVVIVHDSLDHKLGSVGLKRGGSARGHNGLRSIIQTMGTLDFHRLRIGIGRPPAESDQAVVDYVLQPFTEPECRVIEESYKLAQNSLLQFIELS